MITGIKGIQDTGKTAVAVAIVMELVAHHGYAWSDVVANIMIKREGVHCITNELMRKYVAKMVTGGLRHKVILFDEADRLFPARFWQEREQSEALIGLWQDVKLFNNIIWTGHIGTSVDVMLRQTTQVGIIPHYIRTQDLIKVYVFNGLYRRKFMLTCPNVSKTIFPFYNRWDIVK